MILSDKQAQLLFSIAVDSVKIMGPMGLTREDRHKLCNEILNQQSDKLVDLEKEAP